MYMNTQFEDLRASVEIFRTGQNGINKYHQLAEKGGNENIKYRRIFTPPYTKDEQKHIVATSYQLKLIGFKVPQWWSNHDTLRCTQAVNYDSESTLEYIKRSVNWFNLNYSLEISKKATKILNNFSCYLTGVTPASEPVLYIDVEKLEKSLCGFSELFIFFMFLTREKMHVRGFVEGNVIVFNMRHTTSFEAGNLVKLVIDILERSFYGMTNQICFFDIGGGMKEFIDSLSGSVHPVTKNLMMVADSSNREEIVKRIGAKNLPEEIGGSMKKEKKRSPWAIASTPRLTKKIDIGLLKSHQIQPFYFCSEVYREEWKSEIDESDIATVFSETNIMVRRLSSKRYLMRRASKIQDEPIDDGETGHYCGQPPAGFFQKLVTFNCCLSRNQANG